MIVKQIRPDRPFGTNWRKFEVRDEKKKKFYKMLSEQHNLGYQTLIID